MSRVLLADDQALVRAAVPRAAHLEAIEAIGTEYAREQRDDLQRRDNGPAAGTVQQTESEWSQLIGMLELAQRWQELIDEFTGEDAHLAQATRTTSARRQRAPATPNANKSAHAQPTGDPIPTVWRPSTDGLAWGT